MKIKYILGAIAAFLTLGMFACDDDIDSIGESIRPDTDSTFLGVDSVAFSAKTVRIGDAINARSMYGLVGNYTDKEYGKISSDYLAELYCPENMSFLDSTFSIESVSFDFAVNRNYFTGDDSKRVGLSIYELNKNLKEGLKTDLNPLEYCDLSKPLAQSSYVFKDIPLVFLREDPYTGEKIYADYKTMSLKADTLIGRRFFDEWLNNPSTFKNNNNFREFFKGLYVKTTFGEDNLLPLQATQLTIDYRYQSSYMVKDQNKKDSARRDTSYLASFRLSASSEVLQYNHVENNYTSSALTPDTKLSKILSPGGVCTELTIPLKELINTIGWDRMINSASFVLTGDTEEEEKSKLKQPSTLLMVPKDSVEQFFNDRRIENNLSSILFTRQNSYNTYYPTGSGLSPLISYYRSEFKDKKEELPETLTYWIIPVDREVINVDNRPITNALYHSMLPSVSVLRTDPKNLKLKFIYTEHVKFD